MKTACVGPWNTAARRAAYVYTWPAKWYLVLGTGHSAALGCSGTHVYLHTINYVRTGLSALFKHSSRAASQSQSPSSGSLSLGLAAAAAAADSHLSSVAV